MKKTRTDPITGDTLTRGEYLSWIIQGMIRRWTFLGVMTAITILVWVTNNPLALTWWNLGASYLALVIESVVGLAMYNQTRRDAICLREVRALSQQTEQLAVSIARLVEREQAQIQRIELGLGMEASA